MHAHTPWVCVNIYKYIYTYIYTYIHSYSQRPCISRLSCISTGMLICILITSSSIFVESTTQYKKINNTNTRARAHTHTHWQTHTKSKEHPNTTLHYNINTI